MEDSKNIKDDKKENESTEHKEELTEDEFKGVRGGRGVTEQSVNNWIDERIQFLDPSA